jgi:cell wall-associated NlpC family hydrolase
VAAPISKPAAPAKVLRYTVVNGDFLAGIAQQLGVTLPSLLSTNKITASSVILPGMQLIVPKGGVLSPSAIAAAAPISPTVAKVLAYARAQLGKPYKFNTAGPNTFDCSGLVLAAFARIGMTLPHYSGAQMSFGKVIDWTTEAIRPGDLVFYESAPGSGVVDHVGIATSATTWIQAPRSGDVVREGHFGMTRVIGVRRLIGQ